MSNPHRRNRVPEEIFLTSLLSEADHDEIEELGCDPMLMDRIPTRRSKVDSDRLLALLDELAEGGDE